MIDLDAINIELLDLLLHDGRMSYRELGERVGLTAPAVTERIRKLEELGVIRGYRTLIDYEKLGFPLHCVIRLNAPGDDRSVDDDLQAIPEVIEAHRVTGAESHVIRARTRTTGHLEELLQKVWKHGDSVTNIVTSSPIRRRPMRLKSVITPT